jgi:DNA (cytosine-5)-methyltransferase 1
VKVGSLFSGIGGLDLGLERAGMTVAWQSEIDPYACRVLAKHWPDVPNLGDITTIDWSTVEPVDVICGGYPCQPFSLAGVRGGESDSRHLWPYFADALRVLRPRFALLENVPGHLSLGFGRVLGDLAELGFDADWDCIPAAAVGAPHLRYRVFIVAHAQRVELREQPVSIGRGGGTSITGDDGAARFMADTDRLVGPAAKSRRMRTGATPRPCLVGTDGCGRSIGDNWATEPDVGRVAHGVPARMDRLRALGNAVVPQVAEYVGRRLMESA